MLSLKQRFTVLPSEKQSEETAYPQNFANTKPGILPDCRTPSCLKPAFAAQHKGGRLAIAWKHKGDPAECSSHRSLLVSSHLGKTVHRALRQKHHGLYTSFMQSQQLGGPAKNACGSSPAYDQSFHDEMATETQKSCFGHLLDLTEAFYRVVRVL